MFVSDTQNISGMQIQEAKDQSVVSKTQDHIQDKEKIKKVASDFESLFVDMLLRSMRKTVVKSGLIDGGNAENIYQSMLDSEYSKSMSEQKVFGLAAAIERQLYDMMGVNKEKQTLLNNTTGKNVYTQHALLPGAKGSKIEER